MKTYGEVEAMLHTCTILNTAGVRASAHSVRFIYGENALRRPSHVIRRRSGRCLKKKKEFSVRVGNRTPISRSRKIIP